MAEQATSKRAAKQPAAKRELIAPRGDKRYIRRDPRGRIKESDDLSRSLSQDRRRKAKKAAKPGQGDRGDRNPASKSPGPEKYAWQALVTRLIFSEIALFPQALAIRLIS
jgi:hypothetical protein